MTLRGVSGNTSKLFINGKAKFGGDFRKLAVVDLANSDCFCTTPELNTSQDECISAGR